MERRQMFAAGAVLAGTALATPRIALAQATAPAAPAVAQAPGFYRIRVGANVVTVVHDGANRVAAPPPGFVRNASDEAVAAAVQASGQPGPGFLNSFNFTFLQTPQGLVAFDTGNGPQAAGATVGQAAIAMRAAGIDPAAVTRVVISHFHGDHIGGLINADNTRFFPNAQVFVPAAEWGFWMDDGQMSRAPETMRNAFNNVRRRFGPYTGSVEQYAAGAEVAPGVRAIATNGHTPGHTSFLVADGSDSLLILGDLTANPLFNLNNPGWHVVFDMDPNAAEATRRRIFDQAATDRTRCVGYHFPFPANGYIAKTASGYQLIPATWSNVV